MKIDTPFGLHLFFIIIRINKIIPSKCVFFCPIFLLSYKTTNQNTYENFYVFSKISKSFLLLYFSCKVPYLVNTDTIQPIGKIRNLSVLFDFSSSLNTNLQSPPDPVVVFIFSIFSHLFLSIFILMVPNTWSTIFPCFLFIQVKSIIYRADQRNVSKLHNWWCWLKISTCFRGSLSPRKSQIL